MGEELKVCNRCKILKPITEFWKNSASPDGYRSRCKACHTPPVGGRIVTTTKDTPLENGILSSGHPPDGPEEIPNLYQFHHQPDGEMSDYNPCQACNKSNYLFACTLHGNTDTVKLNICSLCVLHSEYGDIVYAKLYGKVYAIRLIETVE